MQRPSSVLKHAWNVFSSRGDVDQMNSYGSGGPVYGGPPDRQLFFPSNEGSIVASIYTRIAIDTASVTMRHVRVNENEQYVETIESGLNNCLTLDSNLDQISLAFFIDLVLNLCSTGYIAIVPVDTTVSTLTGSFDIKTMRVGSIVSWLPHHVRVEVYNQDKGYREQITLEKKQVGIVYNPLYMVMNSPNSTLQRLIAKLNLLDAIDKQSSSGKLDLIVQLPYVVKSERLEERAKKRRQEVEAQLKDSKYGIAYMDGSEKITQLNRPAENNLLEQVQYLTTMLYGQLGLTEEIINGTADETTMLNYYNRTIEPILNSIKLEMKRKFLTKTARSQKQSIEFFMDPFKLVPIKDIAEIADKFTRNEIVTSNEFRGVLGMKPSDDPKADELRNSNMPQTEDPTTAPETDGSAFDEIDKALDDAFAGLGVDENADV